MSFQHTYLHTICVGLDDFWAGVLFNRDDTTISSLCGLVRRMDRGDRAARNAILIALLMRAWQINLLRVIGRALEFVRPGHCEAAIAADIERAGRTHALLETP